jgi:hypothetical protein
LPFSLTNVLATFQALMNEALHDFIRVFVLMFFNDILIFISSWSSHLQHVCVMLQRLREHNLAVKRSKCAFGTAMVTYLGHVISADGVAMDVEKVVTVWNWPLPQNVCTVRRFLGLIGYYCKFIHSYGEIKAPLTCLTTRDAFNWTLETTTAFEALKYALTTAPVLQLPNFSEPFIEDCDTSDVAFGVVLHQGAGWIAFFNRAIAPHHAKLAAYEHELIGLIKAVHNWRPYMWMRLKVHLGP